MPERVKITEAAEKVVEQLRAEHGPLLFHLSGGCCDGSAPMCLAQGDFLIGSRDLKLGTIADCPFYIAEDTFSYYRACEITVDVTPGRGASFSLEIPLDLRFLIRSRILSDKEIKALPKPTHSA